MALATTPSSPFSTPLPARSPSVAATAALGLVLAYAASNLLLPRLLSGGWNVYAAQPLLWGSLGLWCLNRGAGSTPDGAARRTVVSIALLLAGFQVALLLGAGLLFGFGESAYARAPLTIAANLLYLSTLIFGVEMARSLVLRGVSKAPFGAIGVALAFAAVALPLALWHSLAGGETGPLQVSGQSILPATAESWLATLLCGLGGPWAALAYRGGLIGFEWLSPILPDLGWTQAALVSVVTPALAALTLRGASEAPSSKAETVEARRGVPLWLVTAGVMAVGIIWLNTGLLGVKPAIVSGVSMEPNLSLGDIVFTRSVALESLRPGDIIRFREGGVPVLHRLREVRRTAQGRVFITQGDNNPYVDAPVAESAVEGKVVLTVPKVGLIPVTVGRWLGR